MKVQSLMTSLRKLQAAQYRHDQAAHMDIAGLPVPKRVTHFTLHFSKYIGALAKARRQGDEHIANKVIVDSFVIVLAAANAMNVDLQRRLAEDEFDGDLASLEFDNANTFEDVLLRYAEIVGQMSKACEALDHMEDFPSRPTLERGVAILVSIVSRLAEIKGIDLSLAANARWKQIEQKPLAGKGGPSEVEIVSLSRVA